MEKNWRTSSTGTGVASAPISGGKIWLRVTVDIRRGAELSYSIDGYTFQSIGTPFVMNNEWRFFMGVPLRHFQLRHAVTRQ